MTYQEKRIWSAMLAGLLVLGLYLRSGVSAYRVYGEVVFEDTQLWARLMLKNMGIGIVVLIVVLIAFYTLPSLLQKVYKGVSKTQLEEVDDYFDVEDEMDRLIALKAERIGYATVGIGFFIGLITLVISKPSGIMMNIMYLSFMFGSFLEGMVKIILYRRGVSR